jgi:hypothetical protein
MPETKKVFVCTVKCPYCLNIVDVLKEVEILVPAQKAEKRERFLTSKSVQTTLPDNSMEPEDKKGSR